METLWQTYSDELEEIKCGSCGGIDTLYDLQGEVICFTCLNNTTKEDL